MATNINVSERNTSPVQFDINTSTVELYHRNISIYIYIHIYFCTMKPYDGRK